MNKRYELNAEVGPSGVGQSKALEICTISGLAEPKSAPGAEDLLSLVEAMLEARSRRSHYLPDALFAEPAWEMLLALYRADALGYRMTISNLCRASDAPQTTALRWIDKLEEMGLTDRQKNPLDQRVIFLKLTPDGREKLLGYLRETWTALFGRR